MKMIVCTLILLLSLFCPFSTSTCGYESCPAVKDGYLNVHLVPHSHDDMGWLKTVDQYYYGANNSIQQAAVQFILDSVVDELGKDPKRRFIYVETGFFWRWWTNQNAQKQELVKSLVESGQLEFINGGWCMNDEATAYYHEIIDQMSLGLRFLNTTFGSCGVPRVAWQIDPFGHSREQASLFANMGFDGLFFGRLDYQDKHYRQITKNMEIIWSGSPKNLGKSSLLFTSVLYNGYNPPDGFCWDVNCADEPIMDDPKLLGYNLDNEISRFVNASLEWASAYKTNHILMTMGSDFQYLAARTWYKNLDKLISNINAHASLNENIKLNLIYSTPSCYLNEVNKAGIALEVKRDDFFPYASSNHSFWTGYFTSRPSLKFFIRQTNNFLQICKQFATAIDPYTEEIQEKVFLLSEAMGVAQHHDAIAGTAKQHVTFDYALRLSRGIEACEEVIGSRMKQLLLENEDQRNHASATGGKGGTNEIPLQRDQHPNINEFVQDIKFCHQRNISSCTVSETATNFRVHIFNSLPWPLDYTFIRLPVSTEAWEVTGPTGEVLPTQIVPLPEPVLSIPGRNSSANSELVIPLDHLLPMNIQTIHVSRLQRNDIPRDSTRFRHGAKQHRSLAGKIKFSNNKGLEITLDETTGLLYSVGRKSSANDGGVEVKLSQNFYYYAGMNGHEEHPETQSSGAYIFRPNGTNPILISPKATYTIKQGLHVTEIHQQFSSWVSQVIRLYQDSDSVEFEYLIGPIPVTDNIGKEVITKYTSDMKSDGVFYTDSNGRELLKRERNVRPTWEYEVFEPVAGNYYPVNSRMILTENKKTPSSGGKTLILLNDRTQGGSSIEDGEMELMLHRRLLVDDGFGVGEALNETAYEKGMVVRGKHWLVLAGEGTGVPTSIHRQMAQDIYRSPLLMFQEVPADHAPEDHLMLATNEMIENLPLRTISLLNAEMVLYFPIQMLTLERLTKSTTLLRLEHIYEVGEDPNWSKKVVIDAQRLRSVFRCNRIRETILGSNIWKNESHRMTWMPKENEKLTNVEVNSKVVPFNEINELIEFQPMEIKTFILFYD